MGMSSSQVRLLALTARMHDVEYEAQAIQHAKLRLANNSDQAYDEYVEALEETKYQMEVFSGTEFQFQDISYHSMINSSASNLHNMYILTEALSNKVYLPASIVNAIEADDITDKAEFLTAVSENYLLHDMSQSETTYWTAVFYQVFGYGQNQNAVPGNGYTKVPENSMFDGKWVQKMVEGAYAIINKLTPDYETTAGGDTFNIFTKTSVTTDTSLKEVDDDFNLRLAEAKYESDTRKIDQKDKQFDLKLTKLETERLALKTEYDSVKKVIDDNIEKSYKTFNA